MKILAIESSCDETACAVVEDGRRVLANVIASQIETHAVYGGVIPEIAAREHLLTVTDVVQAALDKAGLTLTDIDSFAATLGPGLIGSLLIGAQAAKTLSLLTSVPFLGVNHLQAHVASNYLESNLEPPFVCLLVSGGHTQLLHVAAYDSVELLGETLDDAVGEAYDKIARLLGLGYPGGPNLDALAQTGNAKAFLFADARCRNALDFSFSGIKTAVLKASEKVELTDANKADLAASFQASAVKTLVKKTLLAAEQVGVQTIALAGGVAANSALRAAFKQAISTRAKETQAWTFYRPDLSFCTDNAAMVGAAAFFCPLSFGLDSDVFSRLALPLK